MSQRYPSTILRCCALTLAVMAVLSAAVDEAVIGRPTKAVELIELQLDDAGPGGAWTMRLFKRGERITAGWAQRGDHDLDPQTLVPGTLRCADGKLSGTLVRWQILNARAWDYETWEIEASVGGSRITGRYQVSCSEKQVQVARGKIKQEAQGALTGRVLAGGDLATWATANRLATGADWCGFGGTDADGRAHPYDGELVSSWQDARVAWRAEVQLVPGSPNQGHPACGGVRHDYNGPIVADGKVYFFTMEPAIDGPIIDTKFKDAMLAEAQGERTYCWASALLVDDVAYCFDAATGALEWRTVFPRRGAAGNLVHKGKGGHWSTPVYADGRLFACGSNGWAYALDGKTGGVLWERCLNEKLLAYFTAERTKAEAAETPPVADGRSVVWGDLHSHLQISPCVAGGVVVCPTRRVNYGGKRAGSGGGMYGLDVATGAVRWGPVPNPGRYGSPVRWTHQGKEYIITADMRCIDPATGTLLWEHPLEGRNVGGCFDGDLFMLRLSQARNKDPGGLYRLSPTGVECLHPIPTDTRDRLCAGSTHDGRGNYLYIGKNRGDREVSGIYVMDRSGVLIAQHCDGNYEKGYGGYGGMMFSNDRLFHAGGTGGIPMWVWDAEKRTITDAGIHGGNNYWCSLPAMADGRIFIRSNDGLVCLDLRKGN